jgi:chromosome segregation ATPase
MPLPAREAVVNDDLLDALLRAALAEETVLDARTLPRFAEALRARAAQILAERVQPIEERAAAFEKESAWRAGIIAGLEKEKEYWTSERDALVAESGRRQEQIDRLKDEREALIAERQARTDEIDRLKQEREALRIEGRTTAEAHDRLLEHHRAALRHVAEALEPLPAGLPWSYRLVRARLLELLESLRKETP